MNSIFNVIGPSLGHNIVFINKISILNVNVALELIQGYHIGKEQFAVRTTQPGKE